MKKKNVQKHIYTVCCIFSERNQNVKIYIHIIFYAYMYASAFFAKKEKH